MRDNGFKDGQVDELKIYNRALTSLEVAHLAGLEDFPRALSARLRPLTAVLLSCLASSLSFAQATVSGTVTNSATGATLEINGQQLTNYTVTVSGSGVGGNGAIINSGADSPSARAMPMIAPVSMPGIASGRT